MTPLILDAFDNAMKHQGNRELRYNWGEDNTSGSYMFSRGYTGHEHLDMFKIINMNARLYDPVNSRFFSADPLIQDNENTQCFNRYSYCMNNPVMNMDIDGKLMNPVFDTDGNFRGNTKEGYTGEIIIYDGSINFKMLTKDELLSNRGTSTYSDSYNELSSKAKSKIYSHVLLKMKEVSENELYNGVVSISEGKGYFDEAQGTLIVTGHNNPSNYDVAGYTSTNKGIKITVGPMGHREFVTVENIQNALGIHEYIAHGKKGISGGNVKEHAKAYEEQMKHPTWSKTTETFQKAYIERYNRYLTYPNKTK